MSRFFVSSAWGATPMHWVVPLAIGMIGVFYQMAVGGILVPEHGHHVEFNLDLILFGIINPALAYLAARVIRITRESASRFESRARKTERLLAAINDVSLDAIIRIDARGRVVLWSKEAELLFGRSANEATGRLFEDLLAGTGGTAAYWQRLKEAAACGEVHTCEVLSPANGIEARVVELAAIDLRDEVGDSDGMVIVLHDITRHKEQFELIESLNRRLSEKVVQLALANAELERTVRMRGELLSLVSHDIRAPLASLFAGAEQMRHGCSELSPMCSHMFHVFHQQVRHLDERVRRILDAAYIEAGRLALQREPVSLSPLIRQVVDQFLSACGTRLVRVGVSGDLPYVDADRDRVADVLGNILSNADKYSPAGAEIAVEAAAGPEGVTVRVRDQGPGLPADALDRVFEKFYRADTPGTRAAQGYGLGLYICRELVAAHGGTIRAENNPGGGAVFSFTLPVAG
ncbi:MAG TPA: ATP-binding protein [Burkholderiales bacterium]